MLTGGLRSSLWKIDGLQMKLRGSNYHRIMLWAESNYNAAGTPWPCFYSLDIGDQEEKVSKENAFL